jgi:hypothetical protein
MIALAAEQAALMACARRGLGQDGTRVASEDLDWHAFLAEAAEHGLTPLVQQGLGALRAPPPPPIASALRAHRAVAALRHQVGFEATLRQAVTALHRVGVEPIVLKGGALTYLVYPAPELRTMGDLDLLVPLEQLDRASEALHVVGFRTWPGAVPDHHHHLPPLLAPGGQFALELHHHVLPEANPYALDIHAICARAQRRQLGSVEARVLAPEDMLLHVCVHLAWGHRYQWFPLRTLVDVLALTTSSRPALDWDRFLAVVEQTRTGGAVYWTLRLTHVWLQAPVPDFVLNRLAPPAMVKRLMQAVIESPYVLSGNAPTGAGTAVLYNLLRELSLYGGCSLREQAGAVWRTLLPPPETVDHLPPAVTRSRLRYAARLWYPLRLARGFLAAGALITRLLLKSGADLLPGRGPAHATPRHPAQSSLLTTGE